MKIQAVQGSRPRLLLTTTNRSRSAPGHDLKPLIGSQPCTMSLSKQSASFSHQGLSQTRHMSSGIRRMSAEAGAALAPMPDHTFHDLGAQQQPTAVINIEREFWRKIPIWRETSEKEFTSYWWSNMNSVTYTSRKYKHEDGSTAIKWTGNLEKHLRSVLPDYVPKRNHKDILVSREDFIQDAVLGARNSSMSIRVTAHEWSCINWDDPANDPIALQFLAQHSHLVRDHPEVRLDSLEEKKDSPVPGLAHRYPNKVLFLVTDVCPLYCGFCTRGYAVSEATETVTEKTSIKPQAERISNALAYIEEKPEIRDVVVSGGDAYMIDPVKLEEICMRLIAMPNIERFRIATKGLNAAPHRLADLSDPWTRALLRCNEAAKRAGKDMALHTHFNHPNEVTWITRKAARMLRDAGLTVRNQTVLLKDINDTVDCQLELIHELARMGITPYYVYLCDMTTGVERFRTPLQTLLDIQHQITGRTAGFLIPKFVVDLPGGGGKRIASDYETYDRTTGISTWKAPAIQGTQEGRDKKGKIYKYYDPVRESQT
ncbi:uncharacterized protein B0I36DRAFT_323326 [Microdochium trichocladiopsis]|uniref:Radical SAM core domain-containing protein n=1 Tax=Microdochium trichocladiopsis TaxID=1682393 RepID=A0A9P8Y9I4_9PEZI|nr:uncharacterized protein B0I36DRAFT_323326 [Microdochium trichocladiopsis]KAH7031170.1 hypothetical protein B0I36DRAFT_323326 [Microdochium trichocladiopsis]